MIFILIYKDGTIERHDIHNEIHLHGFMEYFNVHQADVQRISYYTRKEIENFYDSKRAQ